MAGETVEGLLARIDKIIKECSSVDLIFIMTGLNNVAMEDFDFFDSYKKILERLSTAYPSARIFIHSLLPTTVDFIPDESIRNVNDSLKYLLRDTKVEFLDVYKLFVNRAGRPVKDYLLDDGVHLSDKGYAVWSKALEEIINNIKLSHQHPA
ncbi:GDSL-like Lipase/Acylhydrolase [bacterium BMS3Abin06]|nr:GDSL-like Lipase/Acylhydrolase [bacterium BMS3Abin06]